jgi:thiol-disulfide isomerase/thioredoxin
MRTRFCPRSFLAPLALLAPLGCASVTGDRPGVPPNVRTITSIGDRTHPIVSGESGTAVAADEPEPPPGATVSRRVSGRVVDADGEPVPNALVRVAIDGSASGRSIATHTDEAGRFALTNLREGSTYTVIAESEDENGAVHSSRRRVSVPQRQIEITLADRGAVAPARVDRASARRKVNEDEDFAPQAGNLEDVPDDRPLAAAGLDEPAPEADANAWRSGSRAAGRRKGSASAAAIEDDGPNPLPPAIEVRRHQPPPAEPVSPEGPAPPVFPAQDVPAIAPPPAAAQAIDAPPIPPEPASSALIDQALSGGPAEAASAASAPAVEAPAFPPATGGSAVEPAPPPMPPPAEPSPLDAPPPAAAPETQPSSAIEPSGGPPAMDTALPADDAEPPASDPLVPPPAEAPADLPLPASPAPDSAASTAKGPTWGEIAARRPVAAERSEGSVAARSPAIRRVSRDLARKPHAVADPAKGSVTAACQYDSRHRRLADFTLPDLDGNPLRFQDLGADLVLLDFWGTWCGPCVRSVPHLVQLQEQYGPDRLKVVGIAYEQTDPSRRARELADAARELGINYPVLIGEADGNPCPLRAALHVQVYPTMVLLDREGHVLWRDHGATPETLGRLDRIIAAKTRETPGGQLARAGRSVLR